MGGWRNLDQEGEVGFDHRLHEGIQGAMEAFLRGLHPRLAAARIPHRWSGIMGFSQDSLPVVGPVPGRPRVLLAAGFTGHGFGFAAEAAHTAATLLVEGRAPDMDLFAPSRLL